jgi:hypothetical protein
MSRVGYKDGAWLYRARRGHERSLFLAEAVVAQRVTDWNVSVLDDRLFLTEQSDRWSSPNYGGKVYDRLASTSVVETILQEDAANLLLGADVLPAGWLAYAPVLEMPESSSSMPAQGELRWISGTLDRQGAGLKLAIERHSFTVPDSSFAFPRREML